MKPRGTPWHFFNPDYQIEEIHGKVWMSPEESVVEFVTLHQT